MAKKLIGSAALTPSSDTGFDLTTKGDTHGYSDQNARIPISTNNFSLLCDSAEALGLKWAASPTSVLSGAQDILYSSAANTLARLAAGTDNDVLTTHGTGSAPTWETPSAGGGNMEFIERFTLGSAASTFTCTPSTPITPASFVKLVFVLSGSWNDTGSSALEWQIETSPNGLISNGEYSWANNVLNTTQSNTFAISYDEYIICPLTTVSGSTGNIMMDLTIYDGVGSGGGTGLETNMYCKWWQVSANIQQSWGSGRTYDNTGSITSIDAFVFTNSAGNNIEAGTTLDLYKVTS
jgi:hypothetical protein